MNLGSAECLGAATNRRRRTVPVPGDRAAIVIAAPEKCIQIINTTNGEETLGVIIPLRIDPYRLKILYDLGGKDGTKHLFRFDEVLAARWKVCGVLGVSRWLKDMHKLLPDGPAPTGIRMTFC
ncbi:MAG TPA: hypothetical protein VMF06_20125 [Candidatus Limnocylindria bacterium]|nr:hypothetical protein [Candidatus Limnocylindria bacterium]